MNGKINTPVFLGFTALALTLSLSGCIIDATPTTSTNCADNRYVSVDWSIEKNSTGASLSCDQANASTVYMYMGSLTTSWPCSYYGGSTLSGLAEGSYPTYMQLIANDGSVLSDTSTGTGPVQVSVLHCSPTTLPPVVFSTL
jgi:hypothetical protein